MPAEKILSADERERRQRAVDSALGSLRLEGLTPSSDVLQIVEQFKKGELSLDEMSRAIDVLLNRRPVYLP